ncbi:subclass B1 metallo-beta-lactamase, partial [Xanthovirga aplysinae]|uniref:subclass B1 metallo-beta-lactamase n=1 Tax=Xanthovirga aplysinae TaxID=2529853 RepID=UPI0012BB7C56
NTFVHKSFLETSSFGKVSCNGVVYVQKGKAVVFDTPTNETATKELIEWIQNGLECKIIGVVVSHFHEDCLGGLEVFHQAGIESYASDLTIELAKSEKMPIPKNGFKNKLKLRVGNKWILNEFMGEGHTTDNIVSYMPSEKVLFGGCLVKELNANRGYVGDGNVKVWSNTVSKVKNKYHKAKLVVPGHGKTGDLALLEYTIKLFERSKETPK